MNKFAIIEIGSNNTKTHVYEFDKLIYENNATIEFKKNYLIENTLNSDDIKKLYDVIRSALNRTDNVHVYGCSIFRDIKSDELSEFKDKIKKEFSLEFTVVSQEDEAMLTAYGCFGGINYKGNVCIFIGGGGSTELIFVNNKKIIDKKLFSFGVVDVTNHFPSLKQDLSTNSFEEVYEYIDSKIGQLDINCDLLILAGGDHLYWYNNAGYKLSKNDLYRNDKQEYLLTIENSDKYDKDALKTSLDTIRKRSDNPLWFDGSRAMKVITNVISHKIKAKYIIPTKINMEDGLKARLQGR